MKNNNEKNLILTFLMKIFKIHKKICVYSVGQKIAITFGNEMNDECCVFMRVV